MSESSREHSTGELLRILWRYIRPEKAWLFFGLSMIPLVAFTVATRPLLLKDVIDVAIPAKDYAELRTLGLSFFGLVLLEFVAFAAQIYTLQLAGHRSIFALRRDVFAHVLRLPAKFFDSRPIGNLLSRSTSDIEALGETLGFGVFTILTDVVVIASVLGSMFVLDWKITLISLSISPFLFLLIRYFASVLRRLSLEIRRAQGVQTGFLAEQLAGISVLQLFGREDAAHEEYADLGRRYLRATKLSNIYDAVLFALMDGISAFCVALLLYFGAAQVMAEPPSLLTVGLLSAFVQYLQRIFVPISEFSGKLATLQRALAALDRVQGLLEEPTEPAPSDRDAQRLASWRGAMRIRNLSFRYRKDGPWVLRDLDLDIGAGEVIAVVGRTGSGKSTLGRVLTGLYTGYEGSVQLLTDEGPVELASLSPATLRRALLMVRQDVFLFDDSTRFNVSLGDPEIHDDPDRMWAALEAVQARAFIEERGGLDFDVGERGGALSAGEQQLLAFARVAAREPSFLILDEATASVDSLTEQKVQAAIESLLEGRSVLVIAHRLSTIRHADTILVLRDGRVAERGGHESLMAAEGLYAELYRSGFEAVPSAPTPSRPESDSARP